MSNAIKYAIVVIVVALMITASMGAYKGLERANPKATFDDTPRADKNWVRERFARSPQPLPKPNQPEVLLLWRGEVDAVKVRPVVALVDHPEGKDGVYGMDVTASDTRAEALRYKLLSTSLPAQGAWLVVLDKLGKPIASTPAITPGMVDQAFAIAEGKQSAFSYEPGHAASTTSALPTVIHDAYLQRPAPDFSTKTQAGAPVHLVNLRGHKIVLAFFCGCDRCRAMSTTLAQFQRAGDFNNVPFYALTEMNPVQSTRFFKATRQKVVPLMDPAGKIAALYQAEPCPRIYSVDPAGKVQFDTVPDDDPRTVAARLAKVLRA